jgi:chromosome segregation ATPase
VAVADPAVVAELQRLAKALETDSAETTRALALVARELSDLRRTTEGQGSRLDQLERRVGNVQDHLVGMARTDSETTSRVGDVQVELARLTARAGQHADRSEEAARSAQDAVAQAARGKAARAALQAAGVIVGAALVTAAQQCTPVRTSASDPPAQQHAGP